MERESRLQSESSKLAKREAALRESVAMLEQSKVEHQSLLKRESCVRMREDELLHSETEHALEIQRLKDVKEEINLTERRIERKLQLLKAIPPNSIHPKMHRAHLNQSLGSGGAQNLLENDCNEKYKL